MQSIRISVQARVAGAGLTKQRSVVGRCEFYVVDLSAVLVHTTVSESVAGSGCLLYKIRRIEIVGERTEYVFLHIRLHIFGGGVVGHGVGEHLHEEPEVPNYGKPGRGPRLIRGMVIAIEPMINAGTFEVRVLKDGWTTVTADGSLSAHYENTVLITDGEPEILTVAEGL